MNRMRQSWTLVADATLAYFSGRLQVGLGSASPRIMRKSAFEQWPKYFHSPRCRPPTL
jgi:hypothetical protein